MSQASVDPAQAGCDNQRRKLGQVAIWFGLLAPLAVSESRSGSEIAANPITAMAVFRGATPIICLVVASLLLRPRLRIQSLTEGLAVAFITVAILSTAWSVAPMPTLMKSAVLAASYGLMLLLARTWQSIAEGIADVSTAVQFIVIMAFLGALIVPEEAFPSPAWEALSVRLYGVLPEIHPVPLGALSLVAILAAIAGVGRWEWQRYATVRVAIAAASSAVLLLTRTRSALLMAPIAIVVYLIFRRRPRVIASVLCAAMLLFAVLLASPGSRADLVQYFTRGQDGSALLSLGQRVPMWSVVRDVWAERPFFGYGYYSGHRYGPYPDALVDAGGGQRLSEFSYVDSAYLETCLDLGWLGLVILVALVAIPTWRLLKRDVSSHRELSLAAIILGVFIVDSALSYSLQTPSYQGQLFLGILLMAGLPDGDTADDSLQHCAESMP